MSFNSKDKLNVPCMDYTAISMIITQFMDKHHTAYGVMIIPFWYEIHTIFGIKFIPFFGMKFIPLFLLFIVSPASLIFILGFQLPVQGLVSFP